MPRSEKDAFDWSLTYSPESDFDTVPEWFNKLVVDKFVTHAVVIAERHSEFDKWHVHAGFRIRRSYKSDYKWWSKFTGDKAPELEIHYHDCLGGLAGGYLSKAEQGDRKTLLILGMSAEFLEIGRQEYERGLLRKKIRKYTDKLIGIHPHKWGSAMGAIAVETGCTEDEAPSMLAVAGLVSQAGKVPIELHSELYRKWLQLQTLQ